MDQKSITGISSELNKVKSAFEAWRSTKTKGSRIPLDLWEQAIALYPKCSIGKISATLSLSYTDLKKHVESKTGKHSSSINDPVPAFMEFDFSSTCSPVSECVVEMEDGSGSKMRMCFRGKTDFDLLELGKSFWMRRS
jgi:hypothetical protein